MKTLINPVTTLSADGKQVTIICDVEDIKVNELLTTRVTHGHLNPDNQQHPRSIQSSNVAIFIRSRAASISIPNETFAAIASVVEPLTTFAPVFKKHSSGAVTVVSELPLKFQWQVSENAFPEGTHPPPVAVWTDIAGATKPEFDFAGIKPGQWTRLVATNLSGSTTTKPEVKT